jgi:hypothetical protein
VTGPLRFFSEASPISILPSIFTVRAETCQVCETALPRPSKTP